MRIPRSTYRVQFNASFRLEDARRLVPYLRRLGITDLYASPVFQACPGSPHGYDVTVPDRINPELGGEAAFERLARCLKQNGMGLLFDVVPNHMAINDAANTWWQELLRRGPRCRYASFFDIDWRPPKRELAGKVLLPVLEAPYGQVLESGQLRVVSRRGERFLQYHGIRLPLRGGRREPLAGLNGRVGHPRSFDRLDRLLDRQPYRLCYWKVAADEVNYRRFFDINTLAAVRVEAPRVFQAVHRLTRDLVRRGWVTGLRIDHVDGLWDPAGYLRQLQRACGHCYVVVEKILQPGERLSPGWPVSGTTGYDFLNAVGGLFVDRSSRGPFFRFYEALTGIPFSFREAVITAKKFILLVCLSSELSMLARRLDRISEQHRWSRDFTLESLRFALREVIACFPVYRSYVGPDARRVRAQDRRHIEEAVEEAKRRNPATSRSIFDFIGSVLLLKHPEGVGEPQRAWRRDFLMRFQQLTGPVMAKGMEDTAFYRAFPLLSLNEVGGDPERFGVSLQQFHRQNLSRCRQGPHSLLATSTHDTKFSEDVRARIHVLSEMPQRWMRAVRRFNRLLRGCRCSLGGRQVPNSSEVYLFYQALVGVWPLAPMGRRAHAIWVGRLLRFMEKALKEAKVHTSWVQPNRAYDRAVAAFVKRALAYGRGNRFLSDFGRFHARIAAAGAWNALSQTLLKITSPGVADFYQGTELWNFQLVDPDNRRPVDFKRRRQLLQTLEEDLAGGRRALLRRMVSTWRDGRIKLYLTREALHFRNAHPELLFQGRYIPLAASRGFEAHVCAFLRQRAGRWALVAVPRFVTRWASPSAAPLGERTWKRGGLKLPRRSPRLWRNVLTGETVRLSHGAGGNQVRLRDLFRRFPVALLYSGPEDL